MSILASDTFLSEFESPRPWGTFAFSYALQTVCGILLIRIVTLVPAVMAPIRHYEPISLTTSIPDDAPRAVPTKIVTAPLQLPRRLATVLPRVEAPRVELAPSTPKALSVSPPAIAPTLAAPARAVVTGSFDSAPAVPSGNPAIKVETAGFSGSSATPTVNAPARVVQTGGFGDPNGTAGISTREGLHTAAVGSFDLPSGSGQGNGSGGATGVRGTVASAGFGDGIAGSGSGDRGGQPRGGASVRDAGFAMAQAPRPAAVRNDPPAGATTPVQILSKPAPVYTAEARRLKIEGEVVLRVVFGADGAIHDISVVRGLGHGLDEAAVDSARMIRFQPAHRGPTAVDYSALVHVVFQLA